MSKQKVNVTHPAFGDGVLVRSGIFNDVFDVPTRFGVLQLTVPKGEIKPCRKQKKVTP